MIEKHQKQLKKISEPGYLSLVQPDRRSFHKT